MKFDRNWVCFLVGLGSVCSCYVEHNTRASVSITLLHLHAQHVMNGNINMHPSVVYSFQVSDTIRETICHAEVPIKESPSSNHLHLAPKMILFLVPCVNVLVQCHVLLLTVE